MAACEMTWWFNKRVAPVVVAIAVATTALFAPAESESIMASLLSDEKDADDIDS
jgi:hypothetical protein